MTTALPTIAAAARAAQNGDMWVLIPPADAGEVLVVNAAGYDIFQRCDGTRSGSDIAHAIATDAEINVDAVESDVAAFLDRLAEAGILTN